MLVCEMVHGMRVKANVYVVHGHTASSKSTLDDTIVDYNYAKEMARQLEAGLTTLKLGRYFLDKQRYKKSSGLLDEICKMIG